MYQAGGSFIIKLEKDWKIGSIAIDTTVQPGD